MSQAPRFHLDEQVTTDVAEGLRLLSRDCTTTVEQSLISASDAQQLEYCKRTNRVLITADKDFLRLHAESQDHCGIVFWNQRSHFGRLIKDIDAECSRRSASEFHGQLLYM